MTTYILTSLTTITYLTDNQTYKRNDSTVKQLLSITHETFDENKYLEQYFWTLAEPLTVYGTMVTFQT